MTDLVLRKVTTVLKELNGIFTSFCAVIIQAHQAVF